MPPLSPRDFIQFLNRSALNRYPFNLIFQLAACKVIRKGLLRTANPSYVGHMAQLSSLQFVNYLMGPGRCSHTSHWHRALVCQYLLSKSATPGDPIIRLPMNTALDFFVSILLSCFCYHCFLPYLCMLSV